MGRARRRAWLVARRRRPRRDRGDADGRTSAGRTSCATLVGIDRTGVGSLLRMSLIGAASSSSGWRWREGSRQPGRVLGRFVGRFLPARVATVVGGLVVAMVAYVLVTGWPPTGCSAPRCDVHDDQRRVLHRRPRARRTASSPGSAIGGELGRPRPTGPGVHRQRTHAGPGQVVQRAAGPGHRSGPTSASAPTARWTSRQEAARAVDELERLGGFDRAVLNVVTGTGSGLGEREPGPGARVPVARRHRDRQHAVLLPTEPAVVPGGREPCRDGGAAALRRRLRALERAAARAPAEAGRQRREPGQLRCRGRVQWRAGPREPDRRALFIGPTANNSLWSRFTAERDPGTPEVLPTYDGGATVRFADSPPDFDSAGAWTGPRVGYLQHAQRPGHRGGTGRSPCASPTGCPSHAAAPCRRPSGGSR